MRVYGYFYDKNKNLNYGIHEVDSKGNATLVDEREEITFKVAENQMDLMDEEAIERFRVDVEETSLLIAIQNEDTALRYIDDIDVGVNPHKVYYYGKDLSLCFMCQDRALECLKYIAYRHEKHKDFAYNFVYRYLELRENPEANLEELVRDAKSRTMAEILNMT